jgi:hypothetical protein
MQIQEDGIVRDATPEEEAQFAKDAQKQIPEQNKQNAITLLNSTDWTVMPDVADPLKSNPYLMNQSDFVAYRSQVRAIAVNPPTTLAEFPTEPTEVWSN